MTFFNIFTRKIYSVKTTDRIQLPGTGMYYRNTDRQIVLNGIRNHITATLCINITQLSCYLSLTAARPPGMTGAETHEEIAAILGVSKPTADYCWCQDY